MRISILVLSLCLISASTLFAQSGYYEDAFRFSQVKPAGSARIMGVGGTQWSLGGDVSNIAGNPAGLGFFRSSEASATIGYTDWGVETDYLGQSKSYNTTNFSLPNVSFVMANPKGEFDRGAFKGGSFGISIQRIANFNTEYGYFSDQPGETSIIDFYVQDANGLPVEQLSGLTNLAYQTYQINPAYNSNGQPISGEYLPINSLDFAAQQDENIKHEGSSSQINFAYGANFNYKLFIGGSVGIRTLNFSSTKVYNEFFETDAPLLNSSLNERLVINGGGVNLNLGLIYKPIDYLNLGLTFQSPTWYALNDEYSADIYSNYSGYVYNPTKDIEEVLGEYQEFTDVFISSYNLNTPLKIGGGATVFLGKNGFLSADVDWVDYSAARINSRDFDEGPDNLEIQNLYTSTINFRFGAEYKLNNFRFRGGYGYYGDPIADSDYDRSIQQISGGLGMKINKFSIDFALVNQKFNTLYRSYQVLDVQNNNIGPVTEIKNNLLNGVLTLGLSF
ncbi:OmpP1/FadL family transporter [Algoriphagus antarcticus]|uniref:Long-subunit fatty acid transport protein n=1 Tax=Algoriphagus antarcticus TaxID=238540 RepID=A0A3E0DNI6_9BACT|nr:outer membrane protein transport protein [Algoriphagus antarcticus]REG83367.1 long-subunit fatty acid transport protein [Algoriphagus antarcticus]